MGRMKDKFIEEQERQLSENTFEWVFTPNDDCCGHSIDDPELIWPCFKESMVSLW